MKRRGRSEKRYGWKYTMENALSPSFLPPSSRSSMHHRLLFPEWQAKITRINVKVSARVFSKWKSMKFYCVCVCVFGDCNSRALHFTLSLPSPFFLSRVHCCFLVRECRLYVQIPSCSTRTRSKSCSARLLYYTGSRGIREPVFAWYKRVIQGVS